MPRPSPAAGAAEETDVLLAEAALDVPADAPRQLRVVAEFGMRIERQVVGEQVDVVAEQRRQPRLARCR